MISFQQMRKFTFDNDTHTYYLGEKKLLSSTEILKVCDVVDDRFYNEEARARGTAVHACCHYLAEKELDWNSIEKVNHSFELKYGKNPHIEEYVKAYEKFLNESGYLSRKLICEKPIYHATLEYGTIPDQVDQDDPEKLIIELKSGSMQDWTRYQTALQAMALSPDDYYSYRRIGVELRKNGTYRTEEFDDPDDFDLALSFYNVATYLRNKGRK